ncbi:MAG: amino acid permease [Parachlamydiales bacterium]|nr:amino acid permease [Parachlamydiales bacterium]
MIKNTITCTLTSISKIKGFFFKPFLSISKTSLPKDTSGKFGVIKGVFLPNILQMIGVILFMRLGFILGNMGIFKMGMIISMSSILLFITALSMTSIVSNMKMGSGGSYYIISRLLGVEFGSAIGILMVISQHASIALCVSGFALSIHQFIPIVSLKLIKIITIFVLALISYISTEFAIKTQILIFLSLVLSISAIFLGSPANIPQILDAGSLMTPLTFWMAFAMFFPATTGIESGMSMSGDLKRPSLALPIGTIASVIAAFALYFSMALFLNKNVSRDLLKTQPMIVYYLSKYGFLVIIGIWGATLSSALGSILGAPRILQSIAKDEMLPKFLAKGYGKTNQPRVATFLIFITSSTLAIFANINQILPILTMACLVCYGLINFVASFEQFISNPSWRPTFKSHWVIGLLGFLGCFMAMFMINPGASFIVIILTTLLCLWTSSRNVKGSWDDLRYGLFSFIVHKGAAKLSALEKNAKSWRPHILTIFDSAGVKKNLALFSHCLNQEKGFLTFCVCIPLLKEPLKTINRSVSQYKTTLDSYKIPSYLHVSPVENIYTGISQLINNYGFGPLKPNTIILPLNNNHYINEQFCSILVDTHYIGKNLILLKDSNEPYFDRIKAKKNPQINLWWKGGSSGNFELCLALAHMMQNSKIFKKATICIKTIVENKEKKDQVVNVFEKFNRRMRVKNLVFYPFIDPENQFVSNLLKHSSDADLTFIGLKKHSPEKSLDDYRNYYINLFDSLKDLNNVAFVLSGENINFEKIFT